MSDEWIWGNAVVRPLPRTGLSRREMTTTGMRGKAGDTETLELTEHPGVVWPVDQFVLVRGIEDPDVYSEWIYIDASGDEVHESDVWVQLTGTITMVGGEEIGIQDFEYASFTEVMEVLETKRFLTVTTTSDYYLRVAIAHIATIEIGETIQKAPNGTRLVRQHRERLGQR